MMDGEMNFKAFNTVNVGSDTLASLDLGEAKEY